MGKGPATVLTAESVSIIQIHHYSVLHQGTLETVGAILVTLIGAGERL